MQRFWRVGLQLLALSVLSTGQAAKAPDHFTAVSAAANATVDSTPSFPLSMIEPPPLEETTTTSALPVTVERSSDALLTTRWRWVAADGTYTWPEAETPSDTLETTTMVAAEVTDTPRQAQSKPSPANVVDQHDTDCEPGDFWQYDDLRESDFTDLVTEILKELGGAPGKVNVTRRTAVSVPMFTADEPNSHYDTTDRAYWLYDYGATDWQTYVRIEHALLRNDKLAGQYEDVYGELWWSPPGLCGVLLHATYYPDEGIRDVMHAELKSELCRISVAPDAPLSSATLDCSEYRKVYGPARLLIGRISGYSSRAVERVPQDNSKVKLIATLVG